MAPSASCAPRILLRFAFLVTTATGCSEVALVSFSVFPNGDRFRPEMVTVAFSDDERTRVVAADDFVGISGRADTREFETRTSGSLDIEVMVESGAEMVARGTLDLPLDPDWRWSVQIFLREENPHDTCIGCFGYRAFPVDEAYRTSPAESLWMIWGGNSISNPIVY